MNIVPEEERFAKNAIIMAQAIHESVQKLFDLGYKTVNPSIIAFASTVISAFDKHYLIQGFIENSHDKCWDSIKTRNEMFFVENAGEIFRYLPMDKVNLFKDLFLIKDTNGISVVSQSLKDQLWDLFDAMIKISIKYIHRHRDPHYREGTNCYDSSFFDEVDLNKHSDKWSVKLEFLSETSK